MSSARLAVLSLVLTAATAAQQRREPVRGSAELLPGTAWVGAAIHLLSRPVPLDERIGEADELHVVTDDKGRFTANLLVGRSYLAWADEALANDHYRVSFPVEDVIAGNPLTLVAAGSRPRRDLSVEGIDAWAGRGELVLRVLSDTTPRHVVTLPLLASNLLPPMPSQVARIEITCGGLPLLPWPLEVDLRVPTGKPWRLRVPRDVHLRVTDDQGRPVHGAQLALRTIDPPLGVRETCHVLGQTDQAGDVVVSLPVPASGKMSWINYGLAIRARDYEPVGNIERFEISATHDASTAEPAMTFALKPGHTHELRLVRSDQPYTDQVALRTDAATIGQIATSFGEAFVLLGASKGRFVVHRMPTHKALLVAPTSGLRAPPDLAAPLHAIALLGVLEDGADAAPRWDLDRLEPRTFAVTRRGSPDSTARLSFVVDAAPGPIRALSGVATDRGGRVAVLLPPDLAVTVVACTGDAIAVVESENAGENPIELELRTVPMLLGSVVGKNGQADADATVEVYLARACAPNHPEAHAAAAIAAAIRLLRVKTDRDGAFSIPLLPGQLYSLRGVATPNGEHYLNGQWTVGVDAPEHLHIDLRTTK